MPELNSIVRLQYHENRTPTGKRSVTATRKLANYLAFGRGGPAHQAQRPQRGVWYDQADKAVSHEAVLTWIKETGQQQRFTQQLILSVKEVPLSAPAYNEALAAGGEPFFTTWRLMAHADSDYPHAHVIAFNDEKIRIKSPRFREWWLAVRQALDKQQQAYLARQRTAREAGQEAGHEIGQETTLLTLDPGDAQTTRPTADARLQETASEQTLPLDRQPGPEIEPDASREMDWELW
jgi:murein L,D-transpeptidase YcbB/YkuD